MSVGNLMSDLWRLPERLFEVSLPLLRSAVQGVRNSQLALNRVTFP